MSNEITPNEYGDCKGEGFEILSMVDGDESWWKVWIADHEVTDTFETFADAARYVRAI